MTNDSLLIHHHHDKYGTKTLILLNNNQQHNKNEKGGRPNNAPDVAQQMIATNPEIINLKLLDNFLHKFWNGNYNDNHNDNENDSTTNNKNKNNNNYNNNNEWSLESFQNTIRRRITNWNKITFVNNSLEHIQNVFPIVMPNCKCIEIDYQGDQQQKLLSPTFLAALESHKNNVNSHQCMVTKLILRNVLISSQGAYQLLNLSKNLDYLEFDLCKFQDQNLLTHYIFPPITTISLLKSLTLSYCELKDETIASIISKCCNPNIIQVLNISGNTCQSQTIQSLANLLASPNCTLQELRMEHGLINYDIDSDDSEYDTDPTKIDLEPIITVLEKHNRSLKLLDLEFYTISDKDMKLFVKALQTNKNYILQTIYMTRNNNENDNNNVLPSLVQHYLDLNFAGRRYLLLYSYDIAMWPLILGRVSKHIFCSKSQKQQNQRSASTIYYLLRQRYFVYK